MGVLDSAYLSLVASIPQSADALVNIRDRFSRRRSTGDQTSVVAERGEVTSPEVRSLAAEFLGASIRLLNTLQTVHNIGVPPPVLGALWSWPYVVRSVRAIPDMATDLIVEFGKLTMISESDVLNRAAADAAVAVGEALERFPRTKRRPGVEFDRAFADAMTRALETCGRLVAVVQTGELPDDASPELDA